MSSKLIKKVKIKIGAKFFALMQMISDEKNNSKMDVKGGTFTDNGADFESKSVAFADGVDDVQTNAEAAFIAIGAFVAFGDVA